MKNLFIILFAALFVFGCSEDKTEEGSSASEIHISVSTEQLLFNSNGVPSEDGTNELEVRCDGKWRLSGKKTWCRPSAIEGKSGDKITFTVDPNPESEPRTIVYSFICGNKTSKVEVTQEPSSMLDVTTPKVYNIDVKGGTVSAVIKATDDLTYEVADNAKEWITPNKSRAMQINFISFVVAPNPTFEPRMGNIIFRVNGKEVVLDIHQAQTDKVALENDAYSVDPAGETVTVNYEANVVVVPDLSAYSWITLKTTPSRGLTKRTFVFEVASSKVTRSAQIPLKSEDGTKTYATLSFSQAAAPVTTVVPDAKFSAWLVDNGYVTHVSDNTYLLTPAGLSVTTFECKNLSIGSLEGIGAFETLTTINCSNNLLTSLNLTQNVNLTKLDCQNNNIKVLDLRGCSKLAGSQPFPPVPGQSYSTFQKNNLEEVYFDDAVLVAYMVASGSKGLVGISGEKSTKLKISGKNVKGLYVGQVSHLLQIDISGSSPDFNDLSGVSASGGIQTVILTAKQKANKDAGIGKWLLNGGVVFTVVP